jgi:aryl-alcohol dehydrogenase-like predicted oxidoreductase
MRLALGTVQFGLDYGVSNTGGIASDEEIRAILDYAIANGVNTIDTAVMYGNSEERLGKIGIDDFNVITKLPSVPVECYDDASWFDRITAQSLRQLDKDSIYGLLLHRPLELLNNGGENIYRHLRNLKSSGRVEKIGISVYEPAELKALIPVFDVDIVQVPFNILDRRLLDEGWLDRLAQKNIEIHVRSVFLQGLLLMEPCERHQKFDAWRSELGCYDLFIRQSGFSRLEACLSFVLSFQQITKVIVGIQSLSQLKEITYASKTVMPSIPHINLSDTRLINPSSWSSL